MHAGGSAGYTCTFMALVVVLQIAWQLSYAIGVILDSQILSQGQVRVGQLNKCSTQWCMAWRMSSSAVGAIAASLDPCREEFWYFYLKVLHNSISWSIRWRDLYLRNNSKCQLGFFSKLVVVLRQPIVSSLQFQLFKSFCEYHKPQGGTPAKEISGTRHTTGGCFPPTPMPGVNGWLANHTKNGQTFEGGTVVCQVEMLVTVVDCMHCNQGACHPKTAFIYKSSLVSKSSVWCT